MKSPIVTPDSFTVGSYQLFRCWNWDCSGEQTLVSSHETQEDAHAAALADQANNPNNGYSIERQDESSSTIVEQIQGTDPNPPVEEGQ